MKKKKLKKLKRRISELESSQEVNSFYFGTITFGDYVRRTEKVLSRLINEERDKTASKR